MPTIVGIPGSLRARSYNKMLLRAVSEVAPAGATIEPESIEHIPLYNGDDDQASGPPPVVRALKERIAAADGLLLVSPEFNHSIPGVFKNAVDWLSRPASDISRVFGGCPVGVIGVTTGQGGTTLMQAAWLPVLRALRLVPYFGGYLGLAHAARVFDEQGTLQDPVVRAQVEKYVAGFAEFVSRHARPRA